jgi:hypothetical protein
MRNNDFFRKKNSTIHFMKGHPCHIDGAPIIDCIYIINFRNCLFAYTLRKSNGDFWPWSVSNDSQQQFYRMLSANKYNEDISREEAFEYVGPKNKNVLSTIIERLKNTKYCYS